MRKSTIHKAFYFTAMTLALISAAPARAQVGRTYVSAAGSDSNNCANVVTPCRHFQAAVTATAAGGEVVALDPANYGSFTVSQAIAIEGQGWSYISPPNSGSGITINAGGSTVVMRGLLISGAGATNSTGIQLTAGNLVLRNSTLELLTTGLLVGNNSATAHADVINTDFFGNGTAMITNGAGVNTAAGGNPPFTGTQTMLRMNGVNIIDNATAFAMQHAAADVNQNCKYTFWNYQGSVINVTGDTTFFTFSPSNPPFNCNVQSYSTGTASN
ncbi:MAG TPA: hypothetical protein VK337_16180 [Xanthobacteraceae bacterium]|nr:hypothetical protein [Xanthobacteraceae bacterium]